MVRPEYRPIPLSMSYRYSSDPDENTSNRKARCSVRADFMRSRDHFDPTPIETYSLEKAIFQFSFALSAVQNLILTHIDIISSPTAEHLDDSNLSTFANFNVLIDRAAAGIEPLANST